MKKFFTSFLLFTKIFILVLFSGMHFFQNTAFASMPCHMQMMQKKFSKNSENKIDKKFCDICKNSQKILSQKVVFPLTSKEKKLQTHSFKHFLSLNIFEKNLEKTSLTLKLRKNNSPPLHIILKNYLSFKKSVQLRV